MLLYCEDYGGGKPIYIFQEESGHSRDGNDCNPRQFKYIYRLTYRNTLKLWHTQGLFPDLLLPASRTLPGVHGKPEAEYMCKIYPRILTAEEYT
jgi:hypothetical protein